MPIAPINKEEFTRRYSQGEFGNKPMTWDTWEELRDSSYTGRVVMRPRNRAGRCYYGVAVTTLREGFLDHPQLWPPYDVAPTPVTSLGLSQYHFNEAMPDELLAIQGNIYTLMRELQLTYSTEPNINFRQAQTSPFERYADGLLAQSFLREYLSPGDYEDLQWLLDSYPTAKVIEFSTYRVPVGNIPHRRTVWWEVRDY